MLTNAGIAFATACIGNVSSPAGFLYIGYGTGTTAEASSQTTLITEVARSLATFSKESVSGPNDTLKWYGTATIASNITVTEIAAFNASANGGMLWRKLLITPVVFTTGQTIGMIGHLTHKNGTYDYA